jgi:hypothetical protein
MLIGFLALALSPLINAQSGPTANPLPAAIAGPGIIALGSPIVWHPTNAPDTFTANTTFSSTPVTIDNGKVSIWQQQVATGSNGEWDVFYMKTTDGSALAGNINAYWDITLDYTLTAPVFFDQVVSQWLVNGTPVSSLGNNIGGPSGICCASATNPLLSGPTFYNSGFSGALPGAPRPTGAKYSHSPTPSSLRAASIPAPPTSSSLRALHASGSEANHLECHRSQPIWRVSLDFARHLD